jgi:predicted dehydrogenase
MLRGAIVGFGEVARNGHWPAYEASADVEIVAVVDRTAERRELASSLSRRVETFAAFSELDAVAGIDFIDICTPPSLHPQPMLGAIARGWHVLCEKPFLLDAVLLDLARTGAADACVAVVPVHNWKYAPIVRHATMLLESGVIGALRRVEIETSRLRAAPTAESDRRPNWRRDPAIAGGGILMDHGWHAVYLALHWFRQHATTVHASLRRPADGGVEDEARVTLQFPSGDALITLTWNGNARRNAMRLDGELGQIVIGDDTIHLSGRVDESITFPSALSAGSHHEDWFAAMLPDVVACFRNPALARPIFDEAAECLSIIQRAYRADLSLVAPPP